MFSVFSSPSLGAVPIRQQKKENRKTRTQKKGNQQKADRDIESGEFNYEIFTRETGSFHNYAFRCVFFSFFLSFFLSFSHSSAASFVFIFRFLFVSCCCCCYTTGSASVLFLFFCGRFAGVHVRISLGRAVDDVAAPASPASPGDAAAPTPVTAASLSLLCESCCSFSHVSPSALAKWSSTGVVRKNKTINKYGGQIMVDTINQQRGSIEKKTLRSRNDTQGRRRVSITDANDRGRIDC